MSESQAELLILLPTVLTTGYLLFIATVLQKVMNRLDLEDFRRFVPVLVRVATRDVYAIASGTITFVALIPYLIFFGFTHWWFIAGAIVFLLGSTAGKLLNLPSYARIEALPENGDAARVEGERRRLQTANAVRATLSLVSIVLMTVQFFV
jgi:hypothetical protein